MTDDNRWHRLGMLIKLRMEEVGATPEDVEQRGGPKPTKLRELVNLRATALRDSLKPGLEKAIKWQPGSINEVLRGGEPTPMTANYYPEPFDVEAFRARAAANRDPDADRMIEDALVDAERRRLKEDARRGGTPSVLRWLAIHGKPESERTPEERAFLQARINERNRLAELAQRSAAEAPLIDLVVDGQTLAELKNDSDVSGYVRQVESVVVGLVGIERLTDALDGRAMERTIRRAVEGGVLDPFIDELDRLKSSGVEGRELLRRLSLAVDDLLHQQEEWYGHTPSDPPESDAPPEVYEDEEYLAARKVADGEQPVGRAMRDAQDAEAEASQIPDETEKATRADLKRLANLADSETDHHGNGDLSAG
ncbi:hypothetical protein [Mycolicibacterium mageritense]|nr:hypothetical protein [Mycolicibacterium mageritense]